MGVVVPLRAERAEEREPSDGDLVEAAREGARWAKEALYRRHVGMVTGLAHRLLAGDGDVDDLVQDAFVEAFVNLEKLSHPQAFAKWIGSIVVHGARKRIRRQKLRRRLGFRSADAPDLERLVADTAPPDVSTELRTLYEMVSALPTDVRIALLLRRVEGLSVPEIAERMGRSPATVKRRIHDGEVLLQARLERPVGRGGS